MKHGIRQRHLLKFQSASVWSRPSPRSGRPCPRFVSSTAHISSSHGRAQVIHVRAACPFRQAHCEPPRPLCLARTTPQGQSYRGRPSLRFLRGNRFPSYAPRSFLVPLSVRGSFFCVLPRNRNLVIPVRLTRFARLPLIGNAHFGSGPQDSSEPGWPTTVPQAVTATFCPIFDSCQKPR